MEDKWADRIDRLVGIVVVVGVAAMTILLCLGVAAAAAWVIRFIF